MESERKKRVWGVRRVKRRKDWRKKKREEGLKRKKERRKKRRREKRREGRRGFVEGRREKGEGL